MRPGQRRLHGDGVDRALGSAIGAAFAMLSAVLESRGVVAADELGELMGLMAVSTADGDPAAGEYLAAWAGMVRESGRAGRTVDPR